ncbi:MAG: hypothetical protein KAR47_10675 [Planctomycetes bacterium]|nr:hypothetical protein [Planctomycetota bacterium]
MAGKVGGIKLYTLAACRLPRRSESKPGSEAGRSRAAKRIAAGKEGLSCRSFTRIRISG